MMEMHDVSAEIKLKNGVVVLGAIVGETVSQITVSSWQGGVSRQMVVNKTDIIEIVDHVAQRQLIMDRATKVRIERDLAIAREQVVQSERDIEKAARVLDNLLHQRQTAQDAARANPELDKQQARLRAEIKGSKIAVTFTQARVTALQSELNRVNQRILELEQKSWKTR